MKNMMAWTGRYTFNPGKLNSFQTLAEWLADARIIGCCVIFGITDFLHFSLTCVCVVYTKYLYYANIFTYYANVFTADVL